MSKLKATHLREGDRVLFTEGICKARAYTIIHFMDDIAVCEDDEGGRWRFRKDKLIKTVEDDTNEDN
jgi:hypothetical protein